MMTTSSSDSNWFPITVTEQQTALEVLVILGSERKLKSSALGEKCLLTIDLIFFIPSKSNKYPRCALSPAQAG